MPDEQNEIIQETKKDMSQALAKMHPSIQPTANLAENLTPEMVETAVTRQKLMGRLRRAVIASTTSGQWQDFGGNPYMEADAAFSIARNWGMQIEPQEPKFVEIPGGAWQCQVRVRVLWHEFDFSDIGDCDSFDAFFAKRIEELGNRGATEEQIREILKVDAVKKATANAVSRAVSGFAGLRGLSWEDLEEMGLPRDKSNRVEFKKGGAGGKAAKVGSIKEALALPVGSSAELMVTLVQGAQRQSKSGKPYCTLDIKDGQSHANAIYWNERKDWMKSGCGMFIRADIDDFRGKPQLKVTHAEPLEDLTDEQPAGDAGQGNDQPYDERPVDPEAY